MISQELDRLADLAFKAVDAAYVQAQKDASRTRESCSINAKKKLEKCLDLLETIDILYFKKD